MTTTSTVAIKRKLVVSSSQQKVILFGTGARFSLAVLDHLLANELKPVALVLPEFAPGKVKTVTELPLQVPTKENQFVTQAKRLSIPLIYLPESTQSPQVHEFIAFAADFLLLACWPFLLSPQIVSTVSKAALNMHPSLLPDYRGANPVAAQLNQQEKKFGVSIHLLSQQFDEGDIIDQAGLKLKTESPGRDDIEAEAARVGTTLFMKAISDFGGSEWKPRPQ